MTTNDEGFRRLAESAGYVFWVASPDWRQFHYVSPGYEQIWGRSVESLYARPEEWREAILRDDRERILAAVGEIRSSGRSFTVEFRILRPDGTIRWIEGRGFPTDEEEAGEGRIAGMVADITGRKENEESLASSRDDALKALDAKAHFLATMSHEFRTPLSGVIGLTNLLLETSLDREQRDTADTIRRSGEQLLKIINEVLDFSKIDAGKMALEIREFDLQEVIDDALDLLAKKAHAKGLDLLGLAEPNVPISLCGDAARLGQILNNLLDNAVKFTEQGEVFLRVSRQAETAEGIMLRFEVKDTGVGISVESQKHLFQPFRQANDSTARRYGGTGLGLAIVRELVVLMNGEVGVESKAGRGSLFWFTAYFEKQTNPGRLPPNKVFERGHVVIAARNPIGRQILQGKLVSLGLYPATASDGEEVLALLKKAEAEGVPFDLAIIDLALPGMNGLALARAIKADPTISATPLVALNSQRMALAEGEYSAAGIRDVLVEPIRQSRLADRLAGVMRRPGENVSESRPGVGGESVARSSPRILLAEDNSTNRKVALLQLKRLGYQADAVTNGREVIEVLKKVPYDIVLMDCQMPELDGYETTRCLREEQASSVYIIALTAHALESDREKCFAIGMDDYLSKPVLLTDLKAALEKWGP